MKRFRRSFLEFALVFVAANLGPAAYASTFGRVDLAYLVAENESVVVGEAVEARSYWNADRSFILTDVRLTVSETLKGAPTREITVTVPGGKVGDLTSVIVGGAELIPGNWYVLFLEKGDLLGTRGVRYVRDHGQGVFDVRIARGGLRAVSQAQGDMLLPDEWGNSEPVGGAEGLPFTTLMESVRELAARERDNRPEVK
ncbi:MAG: hypothetical protein ACJ75H_13475 [Thermoanaerobaculia bacterium]